MPGGCRVWTEGMSMRERMGQRERDRERGDAGIVGNIVRDQQSKLLLRCQKPWNTHNKNNHSSQKDVVSGHQKNTFCVMSNCTAHH